MKNKNIIKINKNITVGSIDLQLFNMYYSNIIIFDLFLR